MTEMTGQYELPGTGLTGLPEDNLIDQQNSDKWPQLLAHMVAVAEAAIAKAGATDDQATQFAVAAVLEIGNSIGGRMQYIPRGDRLATALKHAQAWRMWKGNNIEEIMAFLNVTQIRAYAVIAEQRKLFKAKIQPQLF